MSFVEYCDNIHCDFNRKYRCLAEEVSFNDKGLCATARYEDDRTGDARPGGGHEESPPEEQDGSRRENGDSWIKYI